jgi:hypothetical protein
MYAGRIFTARVHTRVVLGQPRTRRADLFKGVCPSKKQKEMKKGKLGMQEGLDCTYLVQAEVCFVH